jgi:hypothetical protein
LIGARAAAREALIGLGLRAGKALIGPIAAAREALIGARAVPCLPANRAFAVSSWQRIVGINRRRAPGRGQRVVGLAALAARKALIGMHGLALPAAILAIILSPIAAVFAAVFAFSVVHFLSPL